MGRYKDKILRPSGISQKKVESEFGLKMLQMMGWNGSEGLGAEGGGIKECIQIGRREELEGIGYDTGKKVQDNWWKDSFDQALQKVNLHLKKPVLDEESEESEESEEETKPILKKPQSKKKVVNVKQNGKVSRERSRSGSRVNSRKSSIGNGKKLGVSDSDYDSDDETVFRQVSNKGLNMRKKMLSRI